MTRRERIEAFYRSAPRFAFKNEPFGTIAAELRALWKIHDEYAEAIERLGGTLPPALRDYEEGNDV